MGNSGSSAFKTTFTQVTTSINNDVKQISCGGLDVSYGYDQVFILKNDGTVWSCGSNYYGQLGLGDKIDRSVFTQVTTSINNDVKQISCGGGQSFIFKNDGTVWSCGKNDIGQLGLGSSGSRANKTTFTQVSTFSSVEIAEYEMNRLKLYYYLLDNEIPVTESMDIGTMLDLLVDDYINNMVLGYENNLKIILTDEGVSVNNEDNMDSLITKVDEEFDRKNNEIENSGGGLDIISATELPNVVTNNQIVMLTDTTPSSIDVVSFDLCNPAEGELNVCTTQLDSGNIFTFKSNGINVSLPLTNSYQMVNGLKTPIAGYYGVNDTWVQFSNGYYPMFENGVYLYEDLFGNMKVSSGGSLAITNNNIVATGTMGGSSVDMINTKAIDLSKFERVEMTVSISGSGYFYFAVCPSTNFGTANAHKYVAINSGTYSLDLSSLTGTGYIGIDSTNNTQGKMSITISKIVFY